MENLPTNECVIRKAQVDAGLCGVLTFDNLSYLEIDAGNGTFIKPTLGNALKFSLDTSKQIDLGD